MATEYRLLSKVVLEQHHPETIPGHSGVTAPVRLLKLPEYKDAIVKQIAVRLWGIGDGFKIKLWSGNDDVFGDYPSTALEEHTFLAEYNIPTATPEMVFKSEVVVQQGQNLFLTAESFVFQTTSSSPVLSIKEVAISGALIDSGEEPTTIESGWPGYVAAP